VCCLGEEVREYASVDLGLASYAALEELLTPGIEGPVKEGQKGQGLGCEDLLVLLLDLARDLDALEDGILEAGVAGVGSLSSGTVDDVLLPERRRALLVVALHVISHFERRYGGYHVECFRVYGYGEQEEEPNHTVERGEQVYIIDHLSDEEHEVAFRYSTIYRTGGTRELLRDGEGMTKKDKAR
jgi:hypothetical protein